MRLDLVLIARHPELSRRRARDVIEKGQVSLGGRTVNEAGLDVPADADVRWDPNRKAVRHARLSLPILYTDETILVLDKPAGLLAVASAPGLEDEDTAFARVQEYVRHLSPRRPYAGIVHRLDRDTSGALAFALSPEARGALRNLFREHRMDRRYVALVRGVPTADEGTIDLPIAEAYESGRRHVARPGEPSRPAITHYRVRERFGIERQHSPRVGFAPGEKLAVADQTDLDDFRVAAAQFARRQRLHQVKIGQHQARLVDQADEILALGGIDRGLTADAGIHLRQ